MYQPVRSVTLEALSHTRGLLKGAKFNGRHSTVIPCAVTAVEAARDCPLVSKISLGLIAPVGKGKPHIKFTETNGGLKMQIRGNDAVQIFYLYTTNPRNVIDDVTAKWTP